MKHGHRAVYKFLQPALESACRQLCLCNRNRPQRRMTEVATGSWVSREETFGAAEVRGDSRGQIPWGSWAGRMCFQTRLLVEVSHVTGTSKPCGRVERSHTLTSFHYCRSQRVVSSSSKRNAICKTQHCPLPAGGTEDSKPASAQHEASPYGSTWRRLSPTHGSHQPAFACSIRRFECSRIRRAISQSNIPSKLWSRAHHFLYIPRSSSLTDG